MEGTNYPPCHVVYHPECITAGPPFTSRHRDASQGLKFNKEFKEFPFICEYCTVRANVKRSLNPTSSDMQLLQLERMRLIDCSNAWTSGTSRAGASSIRHLKEFATTYMIPWDDWHLWKDITEPPYGPSYLLLWAMEWYTVQKSTKDPTSLIRYNTARSLRSGLYMLLAWEGSFLPEGSAYKEPDRLMVPPRVGSTSSLVVQLTTSGMERRLGTESTPTVALQAQHIRTNLELRDRQLILLQTRPSAQHQIHLAQLAEILLWLGWLRANELFSLRWKDVEMVEPTRRPKYGLPAYTGVLLLRLLESTKSDQTRTADHVIAYQTSSGLDPGVRLTRALDTRPAGTREEDHIFQTEKGRTWNSYHFRDKYLYPGLYEQWRNGDALLRTYAADDADKIRKKFYSLGSYRRGGRTHVSRKRPGCHRKATDAEVAEHGRWRTRYHTHSHMPTHYQESSIEDRLYITLLCM